ncbi:hypothetical protein DPEC_G00109950 [Dallia pectoralis]|uniref:Uncharacterized protein n=1 Tax=Dallia pectoralis TaxID=75939 RepID=A0ACC2GSS9_DALPE|nr:hypothetical protein DPEC_G00109950 [Dallia pectoralis]
MTTEKISVIFQVQKETVYLTDDTNVAIFPRPDGDFNCFDLIARGHYEVHGDSTTVEKSAGALPSSQAARFSFHRPPSSATSSSCPIPRSSTKTFVRNVFIAEVMNGKLESTKMVTVRFSGFEACVALITSKVKEALGQQESFILTDSHGNEIIDSDGTREAEVASLRVAFACLVCKGPVDKPMFSTCCRTLIGRTKGFLFQTGGFYSEMSFYRTVVL